LLEEAPIHYLWKLPESVSAEDVCHAEQICDLARSIVVFGWGVDMAAGSGAILSEKAVDSLSGEHWLASNGEDGIPLRVPCSETLSALLQRHEKFLSRLDGGQLDDVSPLADSAFRTVAYRRATDHAPFPVAAFSLLKIDASGYRPFDTARRCCSVAAMTRYAAKSAAASAGWPEEVVARVILGHAESASAQSHEPVPESKRFAYLPLLSIQYRGSGKSLTVGSIRRLMVTAFNHECNSEIAWARRALSNQFLIPDEPKNPKEPVALLSLIPQNDKNLRFYIGRSSSWATVTPVVLPGFDDHGRLRERAFGENAKPERQGGVLERLSVRIDSLIRKAIVQAGFSRTLAERAEIEWRKTGFWPGTQFATQYVVPSHLQKFPRYHVKIQWRDSANRPLEVSGPICLGGGRFYGIGLFAALDES
jgi:CRISPR-associated protein Csb2